MVFSNDLIRFFQLNSLEAEHVIAASFTIPNFKMKWIKNFKNFSIKDLSEFIPKLNCDFDFQNIHGDHLNEETLSRQNATEDFFEFGTVSASSHAQTRSLSKSRIELEILQYVNDPDTEIESLHKYHTLTQLFLRFNTCLPSSAPVERLFSFAEIINAPRRNSLTDNNFGKLVLLKANSSKFK